jgi:hypothetical protein
MSVMGALGETRAAGYPASTITEGNPPVDFEGALSGAKNLMEAMGSPACRRRFP